MKFLDELKVVEQTVGNKALFENTKETVFSSFRRACLDLKSAPELLDSAECTANMRRSVWLILLELSKSKLRRKHTAEVATLLLQSAAWRATIDSDEILKNLIKQLPDEFRIFLGGQVEEVTSPKNRKKKIRSPPSASLSPVLTLPVPQAPQAPQASTNPFAKGSKAVGRLVDPSVERWWEEPQGGPDYQQIFLVHKTLQIQQVQERILNQQREILQKNNS